MRALVVALLFLSAPSWAEEPLRLDGHGGPIMDVAVSPDGRVATAGFDNAVGLWNESRPTWFDGHEAAVNAVLFLGADRLASAGDDFDVILWGRATGEATKLSGHQGKVVALAVSPDGATLASASWDGSIGLWPLDGGPGRFLTGHDGPVNDVAIGDDGTLYSASADGTVRAWTDVGAKARILVRHGFGVNRLVLGAGWLGYGTVDGATRLIDPASGAVLADYSADRRPVLGLAHAPGPDLLAVGDGEGYILIVELRAERVVHDFHAAARGPVWTLAFSPDGRTLFAGGLDAAVTAWPVAALDRASPAAVTGATYLTDPALMENGERQFMRKCSVCHSLTPGTARRAGPTLHALFGRRAGSVSDYTYSERLARGDIVWSAAAIDDLFDQGPDHYIPGSKMPMQRITRPEDRADLIAYLRKATRPEETQP